MTTRKVRRTRECKGLATRPGPRPAGSAKSLAVTAGPRPAAWRIAPSAAAASAVEAGARPSLKDVSSGVAPPPPGASTVRRFYASTALDPMRMSRDASRIADEVVKHLGGLVDARVEVRLELRAESAAGVPENIVRTVTENCRTLKFDNSGFEES